MGVAQERGWGLEVAKLIRREGPILALRGVPKPAMARLDRCDHQVADGRQILSGLRQRTFRPCSLSMRDRQTDSQDDRRGNSGEDKDKGTTFGRCSHDEVSAFEGSRLQAAPTLGPDEGLSHYIGV